LGDVLTFQYSTRKIKILELVNRTNPSRDFWIARNKYFYQEDFRYMKFLIPKGLRILDLGCGSGDLLSALEPEFGVGIDFSPVMIEEAKKKYPSYQFILGDVEDPDVITNLPGPFNIIILSDTIGQLDDCQTCLERLHVLCNDDTRIIISCYASFWEPILTVAEKCRLKSPSTDLNWLSSDDIVNILLLSDFETVKQDWRQLIPRKLLGIGHLVNRFIGTLPLIRKLCIRNYVLARSIRNPEKRDYSTTVLIPCRNEMGNIENAIKRIPRFCPDIEIIFVEGHSKDETLSEIQRVIKCYKDLDINVLVQPGIGKADAVRAGFAIARGDILMILDADLTVPPEELPKFYQAILSRKGEFINGSRLVYPLEKDSMRFLNRFANKIFSWTFTYLLNQRYTDTLCGTKVLKKMDYQKIEANRSYFGDFDPFGDYDLIFGASKQNLKVAEVPIRYTSRSYGESQISRFSHGWLLVKMVIFAYRKLKAF
jgi:SAM-dependent methyltransferase